MIPEFHYNSAENRSAPLVRGFLTGKLRRPLGPATLAHAALDVQDPGTTLTATRLLWLLADVIGHYVEYSGVIVTSYGYQPEQFDAVISLCGCGVNLPERWTSRELFEDWFIDDSDGQPIEKFRAACDEIRQRVVELLDSIKRRGENRHRSIDCTTVFIYFRQLITIQRELGCRWKSKLLTDCPKTKRLI